MNTNQLTQPYLLRHCVYRARFARAMYDIRVARSANPTLGRELYLAAAGRILSEIGLAHN